VKHTPRGGRLRLEVTALPGRARFSVRDEGNGVPLEARQRIFEKFGTVAARKDSSYHSAGLGLAFCKLAVQAHGGTIGVDPVDPHGSVFWFELPDSSTPGPSRGAVPS
jgi:two-component system sensor histidine kinase KdpD